MKLFLCSNFEFLAKKYLPIFFDLNEKHNCLLVGYASEDMDFYAETMTKFLESLNFNVLHLNENYDFSDKIDMIFVKGGNTTQLIHFLRKYNQYDRIKQLVKTGSLYVGQSAGTVLAGSDTEWTLRSEPYDVDLKKEYDKNALKGFGFVDKMIFVHCSKLRFPFSSEVELATEKNAKSKFFRVKNTLFYGDYLKDLKLYPKDSYIVLGDNQAFLQNDRTQKIVTFNWSKYEIHDEFRLY